MARLLVAAGGAALLLALPAAGKLTKVRPVEAFLAERSYRPGDRATLVVNAAARRLTVQIFHAGPEARPTRSSSTMNGVPVNDPVTVRWARGGRRGTLPVPIRYWPSGLYFARIRASSGAVGFAPFVLRPRRRGEQRVAVVLPTNTWQAYNRRDEDGDGTGDTWYASDSVTTVELRRAFLNRGVPPHFRGYDLGFLRWLARTGKAADFFADDDLEHIASGRSLAAQYDLIIFAGHEEYVTRHAYDLVESYRDAGGNLAFLSANNFFYRVERRGHVIVGRTRWRDLGRHEASLVGVAYVDWNHNSHANAPYVVVGAKAAPWFFRDTGLGDGSRFGRFGIEIDARSDASPPGIRLLARVPDIFGPGRTAEMTYYESPAGAKVFAAGVMNFGGAALIPPVPRLLENLWARLSRP